MITYRSALPADIPSMEILILAEGQNEWNYLPEEDIHKHLAGIETDSVWAVLAEDEKQMLGFASYELVKTYAKYEPEEFKDREHGYIAEAVVCRNSTGKGIGSELFRKARDELVNMGYPRIYAIRHEENKPSARMMEKAGFEVIDEFDDEMRKRMTAVCRYVH